MATGKNYQGRDGDLHLIDKTQATAGAAGTPWGLRMSFSQMDLTVNYQSRSEEEPRLDRERITDDAHLQIGSNVNFLEATEVSMSLVMSSQETDSLLEFVGVHWASQEGTSKATPNWGVKGTPAVGLVSTKSRGKTADGLYKGGRIDNKGSAIVLPDFADQKKVAIDVEVIWQETNGTNKFGMRLKELYFNPGDQEIGEAADFVTVSLSGIMYGEMERITVFSRAMNVLTSTLFV